MPIAKDKRDGIITNGFDFVYRNIFFIDLEDFLPRAVTQCFRRWRKYPQIFARQSKGFAIIKADFKNGGYLMQLNVGGLSVARFNF